MTLDVPRLRADTPGVAGVLHFNNAGAALPPRPVLAAVTGHLEREAAIGGYEAAALAAERIADVYDAVAALIGAGPDEIVLIAAGSSARQTAVTDKRPVDSVILAIVDSWYVGDAVKYKK